MNLKKMLSLVLLVVFLFSVNLNITATFVHADESVETEPESLGHVNINEIFSSIKFNKEHYKHNDDLIIDIELGERYKNDEVKKVMLYANHIDRDNRLDGEKTGDKSYQFKMNSISTIDRLWGIIIETVRDGEHITESFYDFESEYSYTTDLGWTRFTVDPMPVGQYYKNIKIDKNVEFGKPVTVSFEFAMDFWSYDPVKLVYINKSTNEEVVIPVKLNDKGQLTGEFSVQSDDYKSGKYELNRVMSVEGEYSFCLSARNQIHDMSIQYFGAVDLESFDFEIVKTIPVEKISENISQIGKDFNSETADSIIKAINEMPESKEKAEYLTTITTVMKEQKVVKPSAVIETITVTEGLLQNIRLPEVLDKNVAKVEVRIEAKPLTKAEVETLNVNTAETERTLVVYDMNLMKNITKTDGEEIESKVENADIGSISISVPVPEEYNDIENLVMAFVDNEGNVTIKDSVVTELDGKRILTFVTDHFSYYALMEVTEKVAETPEEVEEVEEEVKVPVDEKEEAVEVKPEADKNEDREDKEIDKLPEAGNASSMILVISGIGSSLAGMSLLRRKKS